MLIGEEVAGFLELGEADENRVPALGLIEGQLSVKGIGDADLAKSAAQHRADEQRESEEAEHSGRKRG
jgi:hypothetical protein